LLKLLGTSLAIKLVRRQSTDAFLTDAFFLSKSVILFLTWFMDTRAFAFYLIIFAGQT
jgi:hypothetical protein